MKRSSLQFYHLHTVTVCLLASALWTVGLGCNGSNETTANKDKKLAQAKDSEEHCRDLLNNALDMLQPDRLTISADKATAVGLINQWSTKCATAETDSAISEQAKTLLTEMELKRITNPLFGGRDAQHIRNCFYYRRAAQFASGFSDSDLDQIVDVFYYVIRNVDLDADSDNAIPLTTFAVGVFGRGTARDRAWLFANFLRQMRLDAVIIETRRSAGKPDQQESAKQWCVAVLLNGNAYLFDMRLGIPIPANGQNAASPMIRQPATLKQAIADDGILRQLDLPNRPYPLTSESLKQIRISLIGNTCFWSPRLQLIQDKLSGDFSVVAFDGFEDTRYGQGLLSRLSEFIDGLSTSAELSVWKFPEDQMEGYANLDTDQNDRLRVRAYPLDAPRTIIDAKEIVNIPTKDRGIIRASVTPIDENTFELRYGNERERVPASKIPKDQIILELRFGPAKRQLFKTRVQQILGEYSKSTTRYVPIRLWHRLPPAAEGVRIAEKDKPYYEKHVPLNVRTMHQQAAESAMFWMATCQVEKQDYPAAMESLKLYLSRYENGAWTAATRYLLALVYIATDRIPDAITTLEKSQTTDSQRDGYELLIRRWKKIAEAKAAAAE